MPFEGAVKQTYQRLSPEKQITVYQFMLFLANSPSDYPEDSPSPNKRTLGALSDRFVAIADDFDEPLDDFEEYMP